MARIETGFLSVRILADQVGELVQVGDHGIGLDRGVIGDALAIQPHGADPRPLGALDIIDEGIADVDRLTRRRAAPANCLAINTGIGFGEPVESIVAPILPSRDFFNSLSQNQTYLLVDLVLHIERLTIREQCRCSSRVYKHNIVVATPTTFANKGDQPRKALA